MLWLPIEDSPFESEIWVRKNIPFYPFPTNSFSLCLCLVSGFLYRPSHLPTSFSIFVLFRHFSCSNGVWGLFPHFFLLNVTSSFVVPNVPSSLAKCPIRYSHLLLISWKWWIGHLVSEDCHILIFYFFRSCSLLSPHFPNLHLLSYVRFFFLSKNSKNVIIIKLLYIVFTVEPV